MTSNILTVLLAERVMGWTVAPDRYLTGKRGWMPKWRFQPTEKLEDAIRVLEVAKPESYTMGSDEPGEFKVRVRIAGKVGEACQESKALAITLAVARAIGIDVEANS